VFETYLSSKKISAEAFDARLKSFHVVEETREEFYWTFHDASMRSSFQSTLDPI
jgi:hypothetical protein